MIGEQLKLRKRGGDMGQRHMMDGKQQRWGGGIFYRKSKKKKQKWKKKG